MHVTIDRIQSAQTLNELGDLVEKYLEYRNTCLIREGRDDGIWEDYDDAANRLGDDVMRMADDRWFELCEQKYGRAPAHIAVRREPMGTMEVAA